MITFSTLDAYGYPKRPCDGGCKEGCPARADCFLFLIWRVRTESDKKKTMREEKRVLREFGKWWVEFEHQISLKSYGVTKNEIRKARLVARCTWKRCLRWMLEETRKNGLAVVQRIMKEELGER